ncbi:hypothetical protein Vretifemale_18915, partial [Volvox reticuliferus]
MHWRLFRVYLVHRDVVCASRIVEDVVRLALRQRALVVNQLNVGTVVDKATLLPVQPVVLTGQVGEAPVVGLDNLLAARELELSAAKRLLRNSAMLVTAADAHEHLADLHACTSACRLAEGTTHTSLEPIRSSTRKHLVNAQHVEGVHAHTKMKSLLAGILDHILVGRHTSSLKRLAGHIFLLPTCQVDAAREGVHVRPLHARIVNADLGVGHTAAETGLGVGLTLRLPVAAGWAATHFAWFDE